MRKALAVCLSEAQQQRDCGDLSCRSTQSSVRLFPLELYPQINDPKNGSIPFHAIIMFIREMSAAFTPCFRSLPGRSCGRGGLCRIPVQRECNQSISHVPAAHNSDNADLRELRPLSGLGRRRAEAELITGEVRKRGPTRLRRICLHRFGPLHYNIRSLRARKD